MKIIINNYTKLLSSIQSDIVQTEQNIIQSVNKQKILMYWRVGEKIDRYVNTIEDEDHGNKLFQKLHADSNIPITTLYQMHNFYKSYPTLPENNLAWSHYRNLLTIKDDEQRKYLENLTIANALPVRKLQEEIVKLTNTPKKLRKLIVKRGKLYYYKIALLENVNTKYVDCGFNIFHEVNTPLTNGNLAESTQTNDGYYLHESKQSKKLTYTYKAFLDKVVDGDTLRVTLDLGFKIKHREILRLAKINAPELKTSEGQRSKKELKKMLENTPFLIIKTKKIDIYGRYVADVFFDPNEADPTKVAKNGIYLNQLLIDQNLATPF